MLREINELTTKQKTQKKSFNQNKTKKKSNIYLLFIISHFSFCNCDFKLYLF